jgi:superoxide dismutase, Fe-Mn family
MNVSIRRRDFIKGIGAGLALSAVSVQNVSTVFAAEPAPAGSPVALPQLPFAPSALAPYISERTVNLHYGKHHKDYVDLLHQYISNSEYQGLTLEDIIRKTAGGINKTESINQIAILVWNHNCYWKSLKPAGGGKPPLKVETRLKALGGYDGFRNKIIEAGSVIGSGWVWLVEENKEFKVIRTEYHESPLIKNQVPLLAIDVWEHAYYLDYENRKKEYINAVLDHLINWDNVTKNI